jgi:hypothetical protein
LDACLKRKPTSSTCSLCKKHGHPREECPTNRTVNAQNAWDKKHPDRVLAFGADMVSDMAFGCDDVSECVARDY